MAPNNTSSTEQTFRTNLSQFAWARGTTDDSQRSQQQPQNQSGSNPFARFYNAVAGDYIPLRSNERSNEDDAWLALSRWERLLGFGACLLGAAVCFFVAFLTMLRPSKFALAFSLGSLLVMIGFSVLIGPVNHLKHLISKERLPFTFIYFGSLGATLYCSLGLHSFFGSLISGLVQIVALVAYVLAYFPGGTQTLRLGGSLALRGAGNLLPR
ncbi:Got1/Sft2-like family-domain-containing protein [Lentinula raphanica]|uniref:Protein transport protein SFT2 n=1 Tax=Lentinula raphanica TaxID=153919 RepID=A0AA38PI11_9AGAR|nr:Got1/Sft2-like family-domain-containing protein [Lentinula raphanica]KAJ3773138.1 Got1/Sft2-like family-domain-containing protein [Lentinula raphanica]KAJ3825386.1 Got1/Sft2-like family-domain-containing protein [Lentinula raphanica]KAJ3843323.1 Got1/Sft2-like family-domain-containing protein [Lentinula raphanica]KAJ3972445.1 Got1/Sft2-like family-domain-containing protein [Lentinula raphanica]